MAPLDRVLPAATAEILLVAFAVVAALMVVAVTLPIAEQSTQKGPVAVLDASTNGSEILVCHESGDNLVPRDLVISLETETGEESQQPFSEARTGEDYDPVTFGAGECVFIDPPVESGRISVQIGHKPTNRTLLDERIYLDS